MKKISIFCLLVLFVQISMAQIDRNKEWTTNNMLTQLFTPLDTVEIKSNNQTYRMIRLSPGITIFQNKETFYLDHVSNGSPDKEFPKVTLYKQEEIYKSFRDNISLYTNPDTLLARAPLVMYITSDMKGNIKDVLFLYVSDLNIPGYVLANIEKEIKTKSRLIFEITPTMKMDDFMNYGCSIEKEALIPFRN